MEFRVLVADQVKAQLYELPSLRSGLKSVLCFVNPAGHLPQRALRTSRPGQVPGGIDGSRHGYPEKHGVKEHAEEVFVRQIGSTLSTGPDSQRGTPLVLIAAPRLLGIYRRHLPAAVRDRIALEIKLDLTKLPVPELTRRVQEAVAALPLAVTGRFRAPRWRLTR